MSDFKLQRIKYQYSGTRANSDVKIRIESGDRWKEIFCPELVNQQSIPITENEGFWSMGTVQEDGFEFQGFAKIKLYEGDQYIGEFQGSSSDVTTTDNNPYQSIRTQDGAYYTLSYRVLGTARNIGIDIDGSRIEISTREVGLVFVPKYNRRWLINVASKKRVRETNLRAKYIQKVNANQGARNPWLGPYTIEDGQQQLKLKVKDPADTTGAFQIGAKDFITYWNAKGGTLKYCEIDNGLDENLALGRGHNGEGDKNLQSRRLEQVLNTLENYAQSQSQPLSLIAFFCHGWSNGCQLGVKNNQLSELADCIKRSSREDVVIVLYACSTAESNELSMAAKLRDLLVTPPNAKPYCRVVGHTQVAHSFYTPDIRVFEGTDGIGSQGIDIAAGGSLHQRFKKYVGRNTPCEGFRWAYPLMSINSIHEFLKVDNPPSDAYQMPIN